MTKIKDSELVLTPEGLLYHIHLNYDTLADNVILVGDPGRIEMFRHLFTTIEYESMNREMHALTGTYRNKRFTALSTGMGCDNIDIVMSELDAVANIDLNSRAERPQHRSLNIVRIGTSGSLHSHIDTGSIVASAYSIGLDGLLNYYVHPDELTAEELNRAFIAHMSLPNLFATPYSVAASPLLLNVVAKDMTKGITVTAPGFYAPQGRHVRIAPAINNLNERLAMFSYDGLPITNLEMETSAIYGMSAIMGHRALTVCLIIANRANGTFLNDYHEPMQQLIERVMQQMANI